MRILEVCPYSAGICGVFTRVIGEATRLKGRGHEVRIFSSNRVKGKNEIAGEFDIVEGIKVQRFKATKLGGESFMLWNFEKEAIEYSPDLIIVHNYRHIHTTRALKIARKIRAKGNNCRVFLVTHAPFVEGNITRSLLAKASVWFYDYFVGPNTLPKFDKILPISNWEIPHIISCGAREEQIHYIPNGIPDEFFKLKRKTGKPSGLLFIGRLAPKKKIETLIESIKIIQDLPIKVDIVGPGEEPYFSYIKNLVISKELEKKISFLQPIYNLKDKIECLDSHLIFVLPSRVEGMPQALIEAMARGKIVIGSNSEAIRDIIEDKKNGYLFTFDKAQNLSEVIRKALLVSPKNISSDARKSVEKFKWSNVIKEIEKLL